MTLDTNATITPKYLALSFNLGGVAMLAKRWHNKLYLYFTFTNQIVRIQS